MIFLCLFFDLGRPRLESRLELGNVFTPYEQSFGGVVEVGKVCVEEAIHARSLLVVGKKMSETRKTLGQAAGDPVKRVIG